MAKVLVTGATGCLGNRLAKHLLTQGHQVLAQGRDLRTGKILAADGIEFIPFDLKDEFPQQALQHIEVIFHCAALSTAWGKSAEFQAVNVTATARLLDAARKAGVARFVFASSPSIYANGEDRFNLSEYAELPSQFLTHYARTKYEAECLVLAEDQKGGMRTTALRPRAIYGAGDRSLMPRLLTAIKRGRVPMIGGGHTLIDITHVSDAARAMALAGFSDTACGEVFNVTSGKAYRFSDLLAAVCALNGAEPRKLNISYNNAMRLARSLEYAHRIFAPDREPVLTCQAVASLGRSLTLDISKAREKIGYEPVIRIENGIKDYASTF